MEWGIVQVHGSLMVWINSELDFRISALIYLVSLTETSVHIIALNISKIPRILYSRIYVLCSVLGGGSAQLGSCGVLTYAGPRITLHSQIESHPLFSRDRHVHAWKLA